MPEDTEPKDKYAYEPDYGTPCRTCECVPTVTVINKTTHQMSQHTELCGPCNWTDHDANDPSTWNEE